MELKDTINFINSNKQLLINTLEKYGSFPSKKSKNTRNCVSCKSSDALSIYKKNGHFKYKCFSCGEHGDTINLTINKENIEFIDAIKLICLENNIELDLLIENDKDYLKKSFSKGKIKEFKNGKLNLLKQTKEYVLKELSKKDFDSAFLKHGEIEYQIELFKNRNFTEYINYSKYTPNKVIDIEKYISENKSIIQEILSSTKEKTLLISPTGSGKNYAIIKTLQTEMNITRLRKHNEKVVIIVPNATQVEQIKREYCLEGAWGDINVNEVLGNNDIIVCTWDKFGGLTGALENVIAIVDEVHQLYTEMYRKKNIDKLFYNLSKCKRRIDVTATPNKLDFLIYDEIIEYRQKNQIDYNVNVYKNFDDNKVLDIINNSKKFALFRNNINYLESIKEQTNKKCDVVHSENKENNLTHINIIENSSLGDTEGLLNTAVITAGVNIKDKYITDIIVMDIKDTSTIKQYVARFRDLESVNVHIFAKFKEHYVSNVYEIEYKIKKQIEYAKEVCNLYNKGRKEGFIDVKTSKDATAFGKLNTEIGVMFEDGVFKVDEVSIRNKAYDTYYKRADIISFKSLLEEHFKKVEIIENKEIVSEEIKEDIKEKNKNSKDFIKELEPHKEYLVDIENILKGKITSETKKYLKDNNLTVEGIKEYIEKNNLYYMINDTKVKKQLRLYTKYVIENKYTYNLAFKLMLMGNRKRGGFYEKVNLLIFREILKECPELIDKNTPSNDLYNFLTEYFKINNEYDAISIETIKETVEIMWNIKLTDNSIGEKINNIYIVDSKQKRISVTGLENNIYINNNSNRVTDEKNKDVKNKSSRVIRTYKVVDYHSIDSICKEYKLNDMDKKCLKLLIDKKIDLIKSSKDKIIEISNIFN